MDSTTTKHRDTAVEALVQQLEKERAERQNAEESARKAQQAEQRMRERTATANHLCLEKISELEAQIHDAHTKIVSLRAIINELQRQIAEGIEIQ